MSIRDDIFAQAPRGNELVSVPDWPAADGKLYAKSFTVRELMLLKAWWREGLPDGALPDDDDIAAKTVVAGIVDANGDAVFQASDLDRIKSEKGFALPVVRMFGKVAEINGLTEGAAAAIKKKSATTPSSDSSTSSPDCSASPSAKSAETTPPPS